MASPRGRSKSPRGKSRSQSPKGATGGRSQGWFNKKNALWFLIWQWSLFCIGCIFFTDKFFEMWGLAHPSQGLEWTRWQMTGNKFWMNAGFLCTLLHYGNATSHANCLFIQGMLMLFNVFEGRFLINQTISDWGVNPGGRIYNDVVALVLGASFAFFWSKRSDRSWTMPSFNKFSTPIVLWTFVMLFQDAYMRFFPEAMAANLNESATTSNIMWMNLTGNFGMSARGLALGAVLAGDKNLMFQFTRIAAVYTLIVAFQLNFQMHAGFGVQKDALRGFLWTYVLFAFLLLRTTLGIDKQVQASLRRAINDVAAAPFSLLRYGCPVIF